MTYQIDLTDIFRKFYPNTTEYTLFLEAHGMFSETKSYIRTQSKSDKYRKIEVISCNLIIAE